MPVGACRRDQQYHGNMTRFREHVWYHLRSLPLMVWRDSSVQHFDTSSGDYVWPPRSNSCVPFRKARSRPALPGLCPGHPARHAADFASRCYSSC